MPRACEKMVSARGLQGEVARLLIPLAPFSRPFWTITSLLASLTVATASSVLPYLVMPPIIQSSAPYGGGALLSNTMVSQGILPPVSPGHPRHPPAASPTISCFESVHSHDTEGSDFDCKLDNSRVYRGKVDVLC